MLSRSAVLRECLIATLSLIISFQQEELMSIPLMVVLIHLRRHYKDELVLVLVLVVWTSAAVRIQV